MRMNLQYCDESLSFTNSISAEESRDSLNLRLRPILPTPIKYVHSPLEYLSEYFPKIENIIMADPISKMKGDVKSASSGFVALSVSPQYHPIPFHKAIPPKNIQNKPNRKPHMP